MIASHLGYPHVSGNLILFSVVACEGAGSNADAEFVLENAVALMLGQ